MMDNDISLSIRDNIKEVVDNVLWLETLNKDDEIYKNRLSSSSEQHQERCMICTLPLGTCVHSAQWRQQREEDRYLSSIKTELDMELENLMDGIGDRIDYNIESISKNEDIDLDHMHWEKLESRPSDRIGSSAVALYAPDERLWHTSTLVGEKLIIVFGGFRYLGKGGFQPFQSTADNNADIEYLSDLRIYDVEQQSWHGVRASGRSGEMKARPKGRYGHCAAALDDNRLVVFGGRSESNLLLNDTWVYFVAEDQWQEIITATPIHTLLTPAPRYFASCARIPGTSKVLLFGGTNGMENFGDLWLFDGSEAVSNLVSKAAEDDMFVHNTLLPSTTEMMQWIRCISVGVTPSPRYGHQMVLYDCELLILGGCTVSPQSEIVGQTFSPGESLHMMNLNSHLQEQYAVENKLTVLSSSNLYVKSQQLQQQPGQSSDNLKDLIAYSSQISGLLASQERDTRAAEQAFVDAYKTAKATSYYNKQKARHANPLVDLYFLDTSQHETSLIAWKEKKFPKFTGRMPSCRMHFNAAVVGHSLFVVGGVVPTALTMKLVEATGHAEIFVLDLVTHHWHTPTPINSTEYIRASLQLVKNDLAKAKGRVAAEQSMGFSLGARNGITKEYMLAIAYQNVLTWRQAKIEEDLQESERKTTTPVACFGACFTAVKQRMLYFGGWSSTLQKVPAGLMFLNVEHEYEKHRRVQEEYCAKMERDLRAEEEKLALQNLVSVYELRAKREAEQRAMEQEKKAMAFQDFLSSLPPLSLPRSVQCMKANHHTLWVSWTRVKQDSQGNSVVPEEVTYILYIRSSFENLQLHDRVSVVANDVFNASNQATSRVEGMFFDDRLKRFPGTITKVWEGGRFDVLYDDGANETNIPRHRLKLLHPVKLQERIRTLGSATSGKAAPGVLTRSWSNVSHLTSSNLPSPRDSTDDWDEPLPIVSTLTAAMSPPKKNPTTVNNRAVSSTSARSRDHLPEDLHSSALAAAVKKRVQQKRARHARLVAFLQQKYRDTLPKAPRPLQLLYSPRLDPEDEDSDLTVGRRDPMGNIVSTYVPLDLSPHKVTNATAGQEEVEVNCSVLAFLQSLLPVSPWARESSTPTSPPTVTVDSLWEVVYIGNDTSYAITGLVPHDVLEKEPALRVAIMVSVQVVGIDWPHYERSRLSPPVILYTTAADLVASDLSTSTTGSATKTRPPSSNKATMSRTKKEIISALVNDSQYVRIERRNHYYYSEGIGEEYL